MKSSNSDKKVQTYLASLSKAELIGLVLKLAPQAFFDAVATQLASQPEAEVIFIQAQKAIDSMLSDEELLYQPSQFEQKMLEQLEMLRGLWDKLPAEIGCLLLDIMRQVDEAFENGYLYVERYDTKDDYFESKAVNDYIAQFAINLPEGIKSDYMEQIRVILEGARYSTFLSVLDRLPPCRD